MPMADCGLYTSGESLIADRAEKCADEMASASRFPTWEQEQHKAVAEAKPQTQKHSLLAPPKTIDELIRQRAATNPSLHIVSYPSSGQDYRDYNYLQLDVFAHRVALIYREALPVPALLPGPNSSVPPIPRVVALLGPSNLEYIISMLSLIKLGHTVLFLSTRIHRIAIESLVRATGAYAIIAHPRFLETATLVRDFLRGEGKGSNELHVTPMIDRNTFEFSVEEHSDTNLIFNADPHQATNYNAFIIHSSGSTGLPKPIYQTHKSCLANYSSNMNMKAFITLPLYHNHGLSNFFRAIHSKKPIYLYNADLPLTARHLSYTLERQSFDIFYGVPFALKLLAESDRDIALLRKSRIVMYGGSACPDELGDKLVRQGVNLVSHYGSTEVGQLMTSFRSPGDSAWNYVRETEELSPFLVWKPQADGLFECCVKPGWPAKVASNEPDGSYATKDLFEPHPTIPRAWKFVSRMDDTIVLGNGEKFVPVVAEGAIRSHWAVSEAVVFGNGKASLGVLVVPSSSTPGKNQNEIVEMVWPIVEGVNRTAESYARVAKSMILVLSHETDYPRTDKGSVIRQAMYRQFADEIEAAYDRQDSPIPGDHLQHMDLPQIEAFIRASISGTLAGTDRVFADNDDFFLFGLDSLGAMRVREEILQQVDIRGHSLPQNVVFDYPSVKKLGLYLNSLMIVGDEGMRKSNANIESQMLDLAESYGTIPEAPFCRQYTTVLTGATGSLGAHVAARLAAAAEISTIYCLVRAESPQSARFRLIQSLRQRRLYHTMSLFERRKLVALRSDQSRLDLGLSKGEYKDILGSPLKAIIHCAWSVNFNMSLSSFEKSNIASVTNLLGLARATGASFNYCSSVSTYARYNGPVIPEGRPAEPTWAQGMGYAQSKSVAEEICSRASNQGVDARVLRIGQIIGDTVHGVWNTNEAIPLLIQTALTMGTLPRLPESPCWLPVDVAAGAVVEISLSSLTQGGLFANVINPQKFSWTRDLLPALKQAGLKFEAVPPREWIRRLRQSNPDPAVNPPIKLLDFFASKYDKEESDIKQYLKFDSEIACSLSPSLKGLQALTQDLVHSFVSYFKSVWGGSQAQEHTTSIPATNISRSLCIFVTGPCGSGKTTIGSALAADLGVPFIEGDALHTAAAIAKMRSGEALTDVDREGWLTRVGLHAREALEVCGHERVVVSCSALRKVYRDQLRNVLSPGFTTEAHWLPARAEKSTASGAEKSTNLRIRVMFVAIEAEEEVLASRLAKRKGHFMGVDMVRGQIESLEQPERSEVDIVPVDAGDTQTGNTLRSIVDSFYNNSR